MVDGILFILSLNIWDKPIEGAGPLFQWIELFNLGYMFFWLIMLGTGIFIVGAAAWIRLST